MTDQDVESGYLPSKVVQYEQFLNETLRDDLKYVKLSYDDRFPLNFLTSALIYQFL